MRGWVRAARRRVGRGVPGLVTALVGVAILGPAAPVAGQTGELESARSLLFDGAYEQVLQRLEPTVRSGRGDDAATILLVRALGDLGRHEEALAFVGGESGPAPSPGLHRWRGDLLLALGRRDEARAAWSRAVEADAGDAATARLRLADEAFLAGRFDEAMEAYDGFIDLYNGGGRLTGEDLLAIGHAVARLGRRNPALFQDALRAFDEAAAAMPGDPRPRVAVGDLFLAKYVAPDAHEEYRAVLSRNPRHPGALLGEARALQFDGSAEVAAAVNRVLETDPAHVGALVLVAELRLEAENVAGAVEMAERALSVNPASLEAKSVLAAARYLNGEMGEWERLRGEVLAEAPGYVGIWTRVAELAVAHRKYADAVRLAGRAVELDPNAWDALGLMGMNQLRTGAIPEGRANLERAFEGDPYNPWFKNSLDLLDRMDDFEAVESEHFRIVLPPGEAEVLGPDAIRIAEEAFAALAERYGTTPPTPIRLELFPRSADFSVRTLGLVGLGALGVSFGSTLVMDSPTARPPGDFNWASTLWHEVAHAFHLAMTDHEVPRWFSEGLAVREQRVARSHWGHRATPTFLRAWSDGRMPPVSRLNDAFVRPAFPGQVVLAYFQGSLVFDWIEEGWGLPAIRAFLTGYRDGRTTAELTREILGLDDDALDAAFDAWVADRYAREIAAVAETGVGGPLPSMTPMSGVPSLDELRSRARTAPGDFETRLMLGRLLVAEERWGEAEEHLRAAQRLFPGYPGKDSPLEALARIHAARGETLEAADALRAAGRLNESGWDFAVREAALRRELGDAEGERAALERAVEIFPFGLDEQRRLGAVAMETGAVETAVRARRAVVGLDPVDVADAWYQLARAQLAAGDRASARTSVLQALERAPSFGAALDLLLEIRGGSQ